MLKGVRKYFLVAAFTFVVFAISILTSLSSVFAANPQSVDYNVYVKPSLSISASTNTVSIDLNPNSKQFGSANLDVTVGTNNLYGYKLFMTTDSNATALERDDTADSISDSIPTLSSSTTTSTFPANYWGYRINNDVGGTAGIIDATGTNFYPYVPANNPVISSATEATDEQTANLTFGAKIDYEKKAGLYELTLKFNALPIVSTYYMQDIASTPALAESVCTETPTVVLDKRDEQSYTIRRINGDCWMVENLRFTGTELDSTTSNVAPNYTPANPYRVNGTGAYVDLTSGDSYAESRMHVGTISTGPSPIDNSSTAQSNIPTVWYNYAAASAGTITGTLNTDPQLYDICPAGWRLPNDNDARKILGNESQFNLVYGGAYTNKAIYASEDGRWWGSNVGFMEGVVSEKARDFLGTTHSSGGDDNLLITPHYRTFGLYVRCVMKNTNINNLNYMQDFANLNEANNSAKKTQVFNSMEDGESYQLKDIRESVANSYYVSKLKDGKVWMVQNLRLGNTADVHTDSITLDQSTSDVSANFILTNRRVDTDSPIMPYETVTVGGASVTKQYDHSAYLCTDDYGCYYNWYTTTAGSGSSATSSGSASYSICPSGWILPTGGSGGQFETLGNLYGATATDQAAILVDNPTVATENVNGASLPGFLLGGNYNNTRGAYIGQNGDYWAKNVYDAEQAYSPSLKLSSGTIVWKYYKFMAAAVRCIVK